MRKAFRACATPPPWKQWGLALDGLVPESPGPRRVVVENSIRLAQGNVAAYYFVLSPINTRPRPHLTQRTNHPRRLALAAPG